MYRWRIKELELTLQFLWKISRGQSQSKQLFIVEVESEGHRGLGEVAGITRNEVGFKKLLDEFNSFTDSSDIEINTKKLMKLPSHLRFGVTSALDHLEATKKGMSLATYLNTHPQKSIPTSFSLPIMEIGEIGAFIEKYRLNRFPSLKIKVDSLTPLETTREVALHYKGTLRVDANEAFSNADQTLKYMNSITSLEVEFIEQPMPSEKWTEYKKLKARSPFPLMADESVQSEDLDKKIKDGFHGINVKLMKAGSYRQALKQLDQAKDWGLSTMLGCMVETSLGIAGAMTLSERVDYFDLDGFLYFSKEPFSHVVENNGFLSYQPRPPFSL